MTECWEEQPQKRPTFGWLCAAVRRLLDDHKVCKYLLLTEFAVRTVSYGPSFFRSDLYDGPSTKRSGHKSKRKNREFVTYCTDPEKEVNKIFIVSLGSKRHCVATKTNF